ncbi:blastula protease 10-like [Littorina saxatilis]|uniref:blastula protease 10-like n=1 Tax=Littorina saxatilis TaxID=31220 RepID=UPI0038B5BD67
MRFISKTFAGGHKMSQSKNITRTVKLILGVVLFLSGLTSVEASVWRTRRAIATADPDNRWTNGEIFYQLSPTLQGNLSALKQAMADWERHTCIRFLPASPNTRDKLLITEGNGVVCASYLGSKVGEQELVLGRQCREDKVASLHELGHAIGLLHENQRPDKDQFVEIIFKNAIGAHLASLIKLNESVIDETLKIPYDYRSIMHLSGYAFAKGAAMTIRTLDPTFQDVIGQRKSLSFRDIKTVNLMYRCAAKHCPQVRLDCTAYHAEAFIGSDCRCACPGEDMMSVKPCIPETQPTQKSSTTNHSGGERGKL